jgi:FtsP/CotA-like multicopper oxidase with cupredoxin domain
MTTTRRGFLKAVGGGALGTIGLRLGVVGGGLAVTARAAEGAPSAFFVPLRLPPVLTDSHVNLVAKESLVQVLPGMPTRMWTFNGSFPGPVIRRQSGTPVKVTVQHRLPASVGSLTIHHHGAHAKPSEDGQPEVNVIAPGGQRTYTYGLVEDGKPERAAFQWYHDHSHFRTTRNIWHGLAGLFIVDDKVDSALPLPKGKYDVPLMLTERSFDASNQLTEPFVTYTADPLNPAPPGAGDGYAPEDDLFGTRFLVNGVARPYLDVEPRKYRFRLLNTSPFRPYNLSLSDGSVMTQIATESGLIPKPLLRKEILFGPGERVEVVIDFSRSAGKSIVLRTGAETTPSSSYPVKATGPGVGDLMELRVRRTPVRDDARVPATLRPLPAWTATASTQPHRIWAFGVGADTEGRAAWTINGQAFDHMRVDAHPELGAVETWMLVNTTPKATSHYIHIHDVDWKVVSRNGAPPPIGEDALKETFRLDPGEVVVIAGKFSDHLGHYMLHCHMLQHEDHGMMTAFEVVPPGDGDAAGASGLESALARSIPDPAARDLVRRVIEAAKDGRPAPASALPSAAAVAGTTLAQLVAGDGPGMQCRVDPPSRSGA